MGSHDETDAALQDPEVKCYHQTVHQSINLCIVAALNELRAVGASIAAGVRGLNHAYPPNLLDAATIAHEVWESMNQSILLNCWLKADILPTCHVEVIETYRRPLSLPAVEESVCCTSKDDNDQPPPAIGRGHLIGEFVALQCKLKMILQVSLM